MSRLRQLISERHRRSRPAGAAALVSVPHVVLQPGRLQVMSRSLSTVPLLVLALCSAPVHAMGQVDQDSIRIERLAALGKLYGVVKFFHPYLVYKDIDWDSAVVAAVPDVGAAVTPEEYGMAIQDLLNVLGDPATRLTRVQPPAKPTEGERHPVSDWTEDSVLVVTIRKYAALADFYHAIEELQAIGDRALTAPGVLFDLRAADPPGQSERGLLPLLFNWSGLNEKLSPASLVAPGQRGRMHSGFAPEAGGSSGGYYSAFYVIDGERFAPSEDVEEKPIVFLINEESDLPAIAVSLQADGKAQIVAEGRASDASVVQAARVSLADSLEAFVRLTELIYEDGSGGLHPDAVVPGSEASDAEDTALESALALLRRPGQKERSREALPARAIPPQTRTYSEMLYPPREYRVFAAFRIWNIIHYFFPYKHLMEEDWYAVFKKFIPRMAAAEDSLEYSLAVAEMVSHIHDTHGYIRSPVLREYFGVASSPILTRVIEGAAVVTQFLNDSIAEASGIEIGDLIVSVDGEDAAQRIDRISRYVAGSTPQALNDRVMGIWLNGPEGSTATLTVRGRASSVRDVIVPRSTEYWSGYSGERSGEVLKMLPGNIGYADLDRLSVAMVDSMFNMFRDTKAIILDMRGYPQGTAWAIAPRLTTESSVAAAKFRRPLVMSPDTSTWTTVEFVQFTPQTDQWRYEGETVMLIDERTISQAEHTGLFFEAANGTRFVGTHTNGANGDVTNFYVPGGIVINFSGHDVRHVDGRQLQRIGLVPDIEVKPTLEGIRTGKDEVLEKALEYLRGKR